MKKIILIMIVTLAFTNVSAKIPEAPVVVGEIYEFTFSRDSNCTYSDNIPEEGTIPYISGKFSYKITQVDADIKLIDYDLTYTLYAPDGAAIADTNPGSYNYTIPLTTDWLYPMINYEYLMNMKVFIEPDFIKINDLISVDLENGTLGIDGYNYLDEADTILVMGETSVSEGIARIDSDTRMWSLSANFTSLTNGYDRIEVSTETKYGDNGVLDYSKITRFVQKNDTDYSCYAEEDIRDTSSNLSYLPGFEIFYPLIFIPVLIMRKSKYQ